MIPKKPEKIDCMCMNADQGTCAYCKRYNQGRADMEAYHNAVIEKYEKPLVALTPSGSEFVNNPERCFDYVRERIESGAMAKKELVKQRRNFESVIEKIADEETLSKITMESVWNAALLQRQVGDCDVFNWLVKHNDLIAKAISEHIKKEGKL